MAVTFDTRTSTFGDRTIVTGSYAAGDVGPGSPINIDSLGFTEINGIAHMGDSQTNINVKTAGNINKPNQISVTSLAGTITMTIFTPINGVANGGGRFMIIGRRG